MSLPPRTLLPAKAPDHPSSVLLLVTPQMENVTFLGLRGILAQSLDWNVKSLSLWHCHFFNKGLMGAS